MGKFRFEGSVKDIVRQSTGTYTLKFVPNQESVVTVKKGKDDVRFAVLLPSDDNGEVSNDKEGKILKYEEEIRFHFPKKNNSEWLPKWKTKGAYTMIVETLDEKVDAEAEEGASPKDPVEKDAGKSGDVNAGFGIVEINIEGLTKFNLATVVEMG